MSIWQPLWAMYLAGKEGQEPFNFLKTLEEKGVGVSQASESRLEILLDSPLNHPPWARDVICCFSVILSGSPNPARKVVLSATC